jgi:LacI family transcriptional regulator
MQIQRVTIKYLADILDVSPKTVSKAINDKSGVSEELRQRIKSLANELNYVPSLFGRGLRGHTTKTIGVIVTDNANPNYSHAIKGIEYKSEQFGYNIILCNSNESVEKENNYIHMLIEKHVDGIILTPSPIAQGQVGSGIEKLKQFNIPYVFVNRFIEGEKDNCVGVDNVGGAYIATDYLIKQGHKKIIYLMANMDISSYRWKQLWSFGLRIFYLSDLFWRTLYVKTALLAIFSAHIVIVQNVHIVIILAYMNIKTISVKSCKICQVRRQRSCLI